MFSSDVWPPTGGYSITTLLMSTLIVTGIAMVLAVPLGLCSAVYLSEYAKPPHQVLKPILEILAGIPSVVVGVFALTFIAPEVVGRIFGEERGRTGSMMAAGRRGHPRHPAGRLGVRGRPAAVPCTLREASVGLGACGSTPPSGWCCRPPCPASWPP